MDSRSRYIGPLALALGVFVGLGLSNDAAHGQSYNSSRSSFADPEPAPRRMQASEVTRPETNSRLFSSRSMDRTADARSRQYDELPRGPQSFDARYAQYRAKYYPNQQVSDGQPTPAIEPIAEPDGPIFDQAAPHGDPHQANGQYGSGTYSEAHYGDAQYGNAQYGDGQYGPYPQGQGGMYGGGCATCPDGQDAGDGGWFDNWKRSCALFSPANCENFASFGGVQAFKGPVDRGVNGNFGIQKGLNWARPLWDEMGLGFQLGGLIALSDFEGGNGIVNHGRDQFFVTSGVFRRAEGNQGWQAGAVLDYLYDRFYVHMNLLQVRWEIAYLFAQHEVGIWSAQQALSDTQAAPASFNQATVTWVANNQFNLFYRYHFPNGSVGRMWIGMTPFRDVIFGGDVTAQMTERWAIQASYNYLLPSLDPMITNSIKETWNISLSMVCFVGYKSRCAPFNPYRPMFNVADNGWFLLKERN